MHFQPIEHSGDDAYLTQSGGDFQPEIVNDAFDDVFGGDDLVDAGTSHPSDMRRLETEHATAGYREGINVGKQATLQKGFDEGYTMGAAVGLQAGQILGVLEGIAEALKGRKDESLTRSERLLDDARGDLAVERLFSADYWKANGEPNYEADPDILQTKDGALSHPLIHKWTGILGEQLHLWKIDWTVLDHVNPQPQEPQAEAQPEEHTEQPVPKDPLDW